MVNGEEPSAVLARLDERSRATLDRLTSLERTVGLRIDGIKSSLDRNVRAVRDDMVAIETEVKAEIRELRADTVTKAEFRPVRSAFYGGVGFVLLAVASAVLGLVFVGPGRIDRATTAAIEQLTAPAPRQ